MSESLTFEALFIVISVTRHYGMITRDESDRLGRKVSHFKEEL